MLRDDNNPEDRFSEAAAFRQYHPKELRAVLVSQGWIEVQCMMYPGSSGQVSEHIRNYLLSDKVSTDDLVLFAERSSYIVKSGPSGSVTGITKRYYTASCRTPEIADTIRQLNTLTAIVSDISIDVYK